MQKRQQIKDIFDSLVAENRSAIRAVKELCCIAASVERLTCHADETGKLHIILDEDEVLEWTAAGGKDNFRNLLSVMSSFAKQYAEHSIAPELSPYRINCVVNLAEFGGQNSLMRLETTNSVSEQRFEFSKI
jgi:hypothetical protein